MFSQSSLDRYDDKKKNDNIEQRTRVIQQNERLRTEIIGFVDHIDKIQAQTIQKQFQSLNQSEPDLEVRELNKQLNAMYNQLNSGKKEIAKLKRTLETTYNNKRIYELENTRKALIQSLNIAMLESGSIRKVLHRQQIAEGGKDYQVEKELAILQTTIQKARELCKHQLDISKEKGRLLLRIREQKISKEQQLKELEIQLQIVGKVQNLKITDQMVSEVELEIQQLLVDKQKLEKKQSEEQRDLDNTKQKLRKYVEKLSQEHEKQIKEIRFNKQRINEFEKALKLFDMKEHIVMKLQKNQIISIEEKQQQTKIISKPQFLRKNSRHSSITPPIKLQENTNENDTNQDVEVQLARDVQTADEQRERVVAAEKEETNRNCSQDEDEVAQTFKQQYFKQHQQRKQIKKKKMITQEQSVDQQN